MILYLYVLLYLCTTTESTGLQDVQERAPCFLKTIEANKSEPASLDQPCSASQRQYLKRYGKVQKK